MPLTSRKSTCAHKHMCIYLSDIFGQIIIYDFWPTTTTTIPSMQMVAARVYTVQSKPKKIEVNYVHILYVVIEKREEKNGNVYFNVFHYLLYSNWFAFDFLHASDTLLLSATMARVFSTELLMCVFVCLSVCPSIRTYVGLYDWYFWRMLIRFYLLISNSFFWVCLIIFILFVRDNLFFGRNPLMYSL